MQQFHSQDGPRVSTANADFAARAPSLSWERIALSDSPECFFWMWCKPPSVPQGLVLNIPAETYRHIPHREHLTLRRLLQAAGFDPGCVSTWQIYGVSYEGLNGANPLLDHPILEPSPGGDPQIAVCFHSFISQPAIPQPVEAALPAAAKDVPFADLFENIELNWNAALQIEKQLTAIRKKLSQMLIRLNSLNRDLFPDERLYADRQDKSDWEDARRWLRDVAKRVSRAIKAHDIGERSAAGQRNSFDQTFQQFIVPRQQFDGMQQTRRDYESYRKMVQTLQTAMNTALTEASQDGERRAQRTLTKIAAKVRAAQSKR